MKKVIVIGGGASGFFAAINIAEKHPSYSVTILEKTDKVLSKVKVSGGGRCNVTHHEFNIKPFSKNYPRGEKQVLRLLHQFQAEDTVNWFNKRGIELKAEKDGRMFPITDSSQTIIDCFLRETQRLKINIIKKADVKTIQQNENWLISTKENKYSADYLIITSGSATSMWGILKELGHTVEPPVPSLFTFKIDDPRIKDLPGVAFRHVITKVAGTKLITEGPLLITHWGLSAPSILRLSAWGALELADKKYNFSLNINFVALPFETVKNELLQLAQTSPKKLPENTVPFDLPKRYWHSLLHYIQLNPENRWCDIGSKTINKLAEELTNGQFEVTGKSTFKEEFVTCGGVSLSEIDMNTMQSRLFPNLFFAGEVIDVDAITGGFNFQNAWTTAWVASENIN